MPMYITFEDVRVRLIGKVRFTDVPSEENKMIKTLAERLIDEAEGVVELDLSPRYFAPFTSEGGDYASVPARPTGEVIKTLCELKSVIRILETDFGSGTAVNGDKYKEGLEKRYKEMVDRLLAKRKDGAVESQGWMYPPLPGLKLNYMGELSDDGFFGRVLIASGSPSQGYAAGQVNDPGLTFYNGWDTLWP